MNYVSDVMSIPVIYFYNVFRFKYQAFVTFKLHLSKTVVL